MRAMRLAVAWSGGAVVAAAVAGDLGREGGLVLGAMAATFAVGCGLLGRYLPRYRPFG